VLDTERKKDDGHEFESESTSHGTDFIEHMIVLIRANGVFRTTPKKEVADTPREQELYELTRNAITSVLEVDSGIATVRDKLSVFSR
jgi:hypothetical protein